MSRGDEFQERDIVRLLIQFGNEPLPKENMSVAEYILADIEESLGSFDNPLYGKIAQAYHDQLLASTKPDQNYFLHNENKEISELAIDLLTSPWEMSPNWSERFNFPLQNQPVPELNFDTDARQAVNRFKLRKLTKMCEVNKQRVRAAGESGDDEGMMRYMRIHQKLTEAMNELAKRAGTVVLPK